MVRTTAGGPARVTGAATACGADASRLTPTAASTRDRSGARVTRLLNDSSPTEPAIPRRAAATATTRSIVTSTA